MGREPKTFCSGRKSEQSFPSTLARCHLKSHHCPSVACVVCDTPYIPISPYSDYMCFVCVSLDIRCQFEIVFVGWSKANTQTQSQSDTRTNAEKTICNDRKVRKTTARREEKKLFVKAITTICRSFQFYKTFSTACNQCPASETMRTFRTCHSPKLIESILSNKFSIRSPTALHRVPLPHTALLVVCRWPHIERISRNGWESDERRAMRDAANTRPWCNWYICVCVCSCVCLRGAHTQHPNSEQASNKLDTLLKSSLSLSPLNSFCFCFCFFVCTLIGVSAACVVILKNTNHIMV